MSKYKVVIVDDEKDILDILIKYLSKKNLFDLLTYSNPNKLLENLSVDKPDMILTDIMMPELNGIDVLKKVKEYNSDIKVIMMTAFSTMDKIQECETLGASDYITKPFVSLLDVENRLLDNFK